MMMYIYAIIAASVVLLDQLTKWLIVHYLHGRFEITAMLAFHKAINRGISWGLFNGQDSVVFSVITAIIIIITAAFIWYLIKSLREGLPALGLTLVCAGSSSNIIDRLFRGGVIDFIECSYGSVVWPNFNIADVCIIVGIGIMLIEQYRTQ